MGPLDPYLELLRYILAAGVRKPTRAVLPSTGEKIHALSVFGYQARYDLAAGFPAVTTKKLAFKAVTRELLWFLEGDTNVRSLHADNVHIWDQWADPKTGDVGPVYGKQWRSWAAPDGTTIDQFAQLMRDIEAVKADPTASPGRRLLVSAWNPADVPKMGLPSCHCLFQFSITDGCLSCHLYQRSADAFLGVPFNIASYALLTHLIAAATGLDVGEFVHSFGDLHIYENHLDVVEEQLSRYPYPLPRLHLGPVRWKEGRFETGDFQPGDHGGETGRVRWRPLATHDINLVDYLHHPALKGEVAV